MRYSFRLLCACALGAVPLIGCSETTGGDMRQWGTPQLIETDNIGDAWYPQVATDPDGNAVAVWHQDDGTRFNIWSNRCTPGGGWETAELIEFDDAGGAGFPQVAMDASGGAIAVWQQSNDTGSFDIWANRFAPVGGWGAAERIDQSNDFGALEPQVAMDAGGRAFAVWYEPYGDGNIGWNLYTPVGGWDAPTLFGAAWGSSGRPQVAMDPGGRALGVWQESSFFGTVYISARRYTPGADWGTQSDITQEEQLIYDAANPQVAMDGGGNAVAVWQQSDGTRDNVWSNHNAPSGAWGNAQRIEADNAGDAANPQVALDPSGNAVAVWQQSDGTRDNVWSNRYTPSDGWGTAELIEADNAGDATLPQVAMDAGGNAVAVWQQWDGTRSNIWSNRYTPTVGWGVAELIEAEDTYDAAFPQIAMDPSGNAVAVWQQLDGILSNIWSNRFE